MKTSKWIFAFGLIASLFIISCGPTTVAVRNRPGPVVYTRPAAPRAGYIWVGDNYIWRGNSYIYQPGHWTAPRRGKVYTNGYWSNSRRGAIWVPGRWR